MQQLAAARSSAARERRPVTLLIAVVGVGLMAAAIAAVAVATIAQDHGRFSWGIGVMLLGYAAMLALVTVAGWRRWPLVRGAMVASSLLHLIVVISLARHAPALWAAVVVPVVTLGAALAPATRLALES